MDYPKSVPGIGLVNGKFVDEDVATGTQGSLIPSAWGNAVTDELMAIIAAAGIEPTEGDNNQVLDALRLMVRSGDVAYALDTGAANTYVATYTPQITEFVDGMVLRFRAKTANAAASTFKPNGLQAKPIVGGAHIALQGGEIVANGDVWLQYNSTVGVGSWVLIESAGGALQVQPGTKSQHALQLGQATGRLLNIQTFTATGTYTKTPGTNKIRVRGTGVGGGGGGCGATSASQSASGGGGGAGAFGEGVYDATNITTLPVTIGTPGVGGNGLAGTNGTSSSFGSLLTLSGGLGGNLGPAQSSFSNAGGNGALPSSAPTGANIFGSPGDGGGTGGAYQTSSATGGVGGKSPFGATALLSAVNGFGCGGSGARSTANASANNGFNGGPAIFIVEEFA